MVYLLHHGFRATMPELQFISTMRKVVAVHCLFSSHILQVKCFVLDSADSYNLYPLDGKCKLARHFLVLITMRRKYYCPAPFICRHGVPIGRKVTCMCTHIHSDGHPTHYGLQHVNQVGICISVCVRCTSLNSYLP